MEETSLVEEAIPLLVSHGICPCGIHLTHFSARLIVGTFFSSIGFAALLAPKVALYTALACRVHRPEYLADINSLHSFAFPLTYNVNVANAAIPYLFGGREIVANAVSPFLSNSTYSSSLDYTSEGPGSEQKCASDPVVQAVVARLNAGLHLHQMPCRSSV